MSADLQVRGLTVRYGDVTAVNAIDLDAPDGSLIALVGPSGCGKTSVLRAVAGFEAPVAGTVRVGGELVATPQASVPPEKRRIGMLFQQGALFPHLTVEENVAFGVPRRERERADDALRLVGLESLAQRRPHELSGGQQQRVALARALAPRPRLILLDEPFAALDAPLRARLREDVRGILKQTGTTAVLVTHDQEEALSIADQVSVMRDGRILQTGTPQEIYERPASVDVAQLVGDANLIEATIAAGRIETPFGQLRAEAPNGRCIVRVATESLHVSSDTGADAVIVDSHFYGHDVVDDVRLTDGHIARIRLPQSSGKIGSPVRVALKRESYRVFLPDGTVIIAAAT